MAHGTNSHEVRSLTHTLHCCLCLNSLTHQVAGLSCNLTQTGQADKVLYLVYLNGSAKINQSFCQTSQFSFLNTGSSEGSARLCEQWHRLVTRRPCVPQMAIIFSEEDLQDIKPPCVIQSFINHNAVLYKVFVVGDSYTVVERPSLKNFPSGPTGRAHGGAGRWGSPRASKCQAGTVVQVAQCLQIRQ